MTQVANFRFFPWQQDNWKRIQLTRNKNRLPHALLLYGRSGIGKDEFARMLSWSMLCESPDEQGTPCGNCHSCHLFQAGNHPDFHVLESEDDSHYIKVSQIREMVEKNQLTPHIAQTKLHLVRNAEQMNPAAANGLLKTLEEPSHNTLIILVTSHPEALPATILSRCQKLETRTPSNSEAMAWLQSRDVSSDPQLLLSITGNAPLSALSLDKTEWLPVRSELFKQLLDVIAGKTDPLKIKIDWKKVNISLVIEWLLTWVIDLIRLKYNQQESQITNIDFSHDLKKICTAYSIQQLFLLYDDYLESRRLAEKQLNQPLLADSLFLHWT